MDLIGLTPRDAERLGRLLLAFESGQLTARRYSGHTEPQRNYSAVAFRNDSGETIPAYAVMRVTGWVSVYDEIVLTVAKPNSTFNRLYLINGPDEQTVNHPYGTASKAYDHEYSLYESGTTPATGESWGAQSGSWRLAQHRPGFNVMGRVTGSGSDSRVLVIQSVPEVVFGLADAAIASGGSGTVRVYCGTQGSESDTGLTIASCYNYGPAIADEGKVAVTWMNNKPYVGRMVC